MSRPRMAGLLSAALSVAASALADSHPSSLIRRQELVFEKRTGEAAFVTRSGAFAVSLDRNGARLTGIGNDTRPISYRMRLAGGSRAVPPEGAALSPGKINYLIGPESNWRKNVAGYTNVRYAGVYRGVDLIFYGRKDRIEYDFVLKPGSDPSVIKVQWDGARLKLNERGDLMIATGSSHIQWDAPFLYQTVNGVRNQVAGGFKLLGGNRVGFSVGAFDPRLDLVIDPTLAFATYLGGSSQEFSRGIAADSSGNVYVAGLTNSSNLPVTKTGYQTGYGGNTDNINGGDAFVAKYNASGALQFLTYLGGRGDDAAMALALDASGNLYITGYTNSSDFPVTPGAFQTTFGGYSGAGAIVLGDAFVTKLSLDGTKLLYSTYVGGSRDDAAFGIAVDNSGNAYITGTTVSTNFPVTGNAYQSNVAGFGNQEVFPRLGTAAIVAGDAFVAKLNAAGSALVYSTFIGGTGDDLATAIAIDSSGAAYVGGFTLSTNFPTTPGALQTKFGGSEAQNAFFIFGDGFLAKLDPTGSKLVYSTYVGGKGDDWVSALTVDASGNVYATGSTSSTNFPVTAGAFQPSYRGPTALPLLVEQLIGDAFVLKLNPAGTALVFSTYLGGSGDDCGLAIVLDAGGNVLVAGSTDSKDFPATPNAVQPALAGPGYSQVRNKSGDGFVAQFTPGGAEEYATFLGGTDDEAIFSMAVTTSGTVYVSGFTFSQNFPVIGAAQAKNGSGATTAMDAFVASISGLGLSSGSGPVISTVLNSAGETSGVAQNTWIEIKGQNLAPDTRQWQGSDFVNGQMPTQLDGVSVKVNGKPAFIYYISPQQVNALTPIDSTTGQVFVQLTNASVSGENVAVSLQPYAPGFFQFDGIHVAATHLNGSLIGPTTLYPGLSTPAQPNETIVIYATGFGQTSPPIVNGLASQSGTLTITPALKIGGFIASVQFAGVVAPGEYQFNVVVPGNLPDGDATIAATLNNVSTQPGALITIHH